MNAVNDRLGRHAFKANRKLVLQRCEELGMRTRKALLASRDNPNPDDVDAAVWALRQSVVDLIELRHKNETSDRVMEEERLIRGSASALQGLLDDMWAAKFGIKLEAAE